MVIFGVGASLYPALAAYMYVHVRAVDICYSLLSNNGSSHNVRVHVCETYIILLVKYSAR